MSVTKQTRKVASRKPRRKEDLASRWAAELERVRTPTWKERTVAEIAARLIAEGFPDHITVGSDKLEIRDVISRYFEGAERFSQFNPGSVTMHQIGNHRYSFESDSPSFRDAVKNLVADGLSEEAARASVVNSHHLFVERKAEADTRDFLSQLQSMLRIAISFQFCASGERTKVFMSGTTLESPSARVIIAFPPDKTRRRDEAREWITKFTMRHLNLVPSIGRTKGLQDSPESSRQKKKHEALDEFDRQREHQIQQTMNSRGCTREAACQSLSYTALYSQVAAALVPANADPRAHAIAVERKAAAVKKLVENREAKPSGMKKRP